jgi:hypothetical protein
VDLIVRYFQLRQEGSILSDDIVKKNAGLLFAAGHFSYAELPKSFGLIMVSHFFSRAIL